MNINQIADLLCMKIPKEHIKFNEPMKKYTTFRIGGPVDLLVTPSSIEEVIHIIQICNTYNIPFYVIGNGSNLLVDDAGFRGVIIQLGKNFAKIHVQGETIVAEAGAVLAKVASAALEHGLTGLEFAHGIPGTIGGAVTMNAGAYDGVMKDVVVSSTVVDKQGKLMILTNEELELGYRTSRIQKEDFIVLSTTLSVALGDREQIEAKMKDFNSRRRDKQPLDKPSAGSTFKRPEGYFAGKLIMDAGLRGYKVGGAMISEKHCGFVISDGSATCADVIKLIEDVKKIVKEKFNVELEPEVKRLRS